jgi:hypothetical protein
MSDQWPLDSQQIDRHTWITDAFGKDLTVVIGLTGHPCSEYAIGFANMV